MPLPLRRPISGESPPDETLDTRPRLLRLAAVAGAATALLFALVLTLGNFAYESGDDPAMLQMVSGAATGVPSEKLVFTNVAIGHILKHLYIWNGTIEWYSIYLLTTHLIASAGILYAFFRRQPGRLAICAWLLLFAVLQLRLLLEFQFTSTAMVAGAAGLILLLDGMADEARGRRFSLLAGAGLLVLSAMIRFHAFLFASLIAGPLIALEVFVVARSSGVVGTARKFFPLATAITVAIGFVAYDRSVYIRDPEWKSFLSLQRVRAELYDYPSIEEYAPNSRFLFHRLGWSGNDFNMFRHYYLADEEIANESSLHVLLDRFGRAARSGSAAREHRTEYFWSTWPYAALVLLNAILAVATARSERFRCAFAAVATIGLVAAIFVYFSFYAKLASRVTIPAFYCASSLLFFAALRWRKSQRQNSDSLPQNRDPARRYSVALLNFLLAVAYGVSAFEATRLNSDLNALNEVKRRSFTHLTARIAGDYDVTKNKPCFIVWGSEYPYSWSGPNWVVSKSEPRLQTIGIGWNANSPVYYEQLANAGIDNVYRAIYERPDVYCFGSQFDVENMSNYAWEHFGETIDTEIPRHYVYDVDGPIQPAHLRIRRMTRINPDDAQRSSTHEESSLR